MSALQKIAKTIGALATVMIMTVVNVFICFILADVVMIQLIQNGSNKYFALFVGICTAIVGHIYIAYNHKMKAHLTSNHTQEQKYDE